MVGKDRRAVGGAYAGDVGEVLDGDRQASEQAAFSGRQARDAVGMRARAFEAQCRQRVDGAVDRRNTALQRSEEVMRRDLLAPQQVDDRAGVGAMELDVTLLGCARGVAGV